jgi:WD40 repeat protein
MLRKPFPWLVLILCGLIVAGLVVWLEPQMHIRIIARVPLPLQIAVSPDGKQIAFGTLRDGAFLSDAPDGNELANIASGRVNDVVFTPDGQWVITGGASDQGKVEIWRVADHTLQQTLDPALTRWVSDLAVSSDSSLLAVATSDQVALFRIADGTLLRTFATSGSSVAFSPDGTLLAVGANEPVIRVYAVATGTMVHTWEGHGLSIAFSPDGQTIAAPGWPDSSIVHFRDAATGQERGALPTQHGQIHSLAFSPDGRLFVSSTNGAAVNLWRVSDGTLLERRRFRNSIDAVAFTPDGQGIVIANWDFIRLWNISDYATGRM